MKPDRPLPSIPPADPPGRATDERATDARDADSPRPARITDQPELPFTTRVLLVLLGWLLIALGVVGGLLPVLQGWIFFLAGAALLSLVSDTAMRSLRWTFRPWPRGWRRVLRFRRRVIAWLQSQHDLNEP